MLYEKAVASSPTLRGGVHDRQQNDIATMAEAVAKRRGLSKPDESCFLLGAVGLLTYRRALTAWLAGPASADLAAMIAGNFELLKGLLGPAATDAVATAVASAQCCASTHPTTRDVGRRQVQAPSRLSRLMSSSRLAELAQDVVGVLGEERAARHRRRRLVELHRVGHELALDAVGVDDREEAPVGLELRIDDELGRVLGRRPRTLERLQLLDPVARTASPRSRPRPARRPRRCWS